ncbi:hypothetical protein F2Q68_00020554 [Brassica cretica]|uniref:Uncharacterized protein n=1 Tax=Brassica cretica TaxID=69181 RepID=A0A8S9FMR9_BRACR|nr:hypothetical protein F2Q68_00020554 [Brassica cretica]
MSLLGIGVPHGVPEDIWVHLELKGERLNRSDTARSLASPSHGATRPGVTQRGRSRLHHPERRDRSDTARSLASPSPGAT